MEQITLVELRKRENLSQGELAELLNVSRGAIGMYEIGKRTPPLNKAKELATIFNVPVEKIVFAGNK